MIRNDKEKSRHSLLQMENNSLTGHEEDIFDQVRMEEIWNNEACELKNDKQSDLRQEFTDEIINNTFRLFIPSKEGGYTQQDLEIIINGLEIPVKLSPNSDKTNFYIKPMRLDNPHLPYYMTEEEILLYNRTLLINYIIYYFIKNPTEYSNAHINKLLNLKNILNYNSMYYSPDYFPNITDLSFYIDPYTGEYDYAKYFDVNKLLIEYSSRLNGRVNEHELINYIEKYKNKSRLSLTTSYQLPDKMAIPSENILLLMSGLDHTFFENLTTNQIHQILQVRFNGYFSNYPSTIDTLKLGIISWSISHDPNFMSNIREIQPLVEILRKNPSYICRNVIIFSLYERLNLKEYYHHQESATEEENIRRQTEVLINLYYKETANDMNIVKIHLDNFLKAYEEGDIHKMLNELKIIKSKNIRFILPFNINNVIKFYKNLAKTGANIPKQMIGKKYIPKNYDPEDANIYLSIFLKLKDISKCNL